MTTPIMIDTTMSVRMIRFRTGDAAGGRFSASGVLGDVDDEVDDMVVLYFLAKALY